MRKYELHVIETMGHNFNRDFQKMQSEGWEIAGQMCTKPCNGSGGHNSSTWVSLPIRREIKPEKKSGLLRSWFGRGNLVDNT